MSIFSVYIKGLYFLASYLMIKSCEASITHATLSKDCCPLSTASFHYLHFGSSPNSIIIKVNYCVFPYTNETIRPLLYPSLSQLDHIPININLKPLALLFQRLCKHQLPHPINPLIPRFNSKMMRLLLLFSPAPTTHPWLPVPL